MIGARIYCRRIAAASVVALALVVAAFAEAPATYGAGLSLDINPLVCVYEDAAGNATPEAVVGLYRAGRLPRLGDRPLSAGYTRSSFWCVLPLPEAFRGERATLFATAPGLYDLRVYAPRVGGGFDLTEGSYVTPFERRTVPLAVAAVVFKAPTVEEGQSFIVFRIASESSINTSFALSDDIGAYKFKYDRSVLLSAIFAILVALFAYNLVVALSAGERDFLFYVPYLAFYILYLADLQFIDFQLLFPSYSVSLSKLVSPLLGSATLFCSALFSRSFLGIDRRQRPLELGLFAVMLLSLSLAAVSLSGLPYFEVSRYGNTIAPIIIAAEIAIIIVRIVQGYRPAVFFLIANAGTVAGVALFDLSAYGLVHGSLFAANANLIGQALQLALFSVSLALKLNLEKRARLEAQGYIARQEAASRRFVPKEFLEYLGKKEISEVELGQMTEEDMTVMFADIRSFTTLTEHMSPRETFDFVNAYLSRIVPTIKDYGGFIDKFIGDSVMALFPAESDAALRAAIEIQQVIVDFNEERVFSGEQPIRTGIGMHTGRLMLGVIGDSERLESTVLSDAVNLASRVEKLNKFFGTSVLVTEETFKGLEDPLQFKYRFLGMVRVKGKSMPSSIFEIIGGENLVCCLLQLT